MKKTFICFAMGALLSFSPFHSKAQKAQLPVYKDVPFAQDYSIKYYTSGDFKKVFSDRNGMIKVSSSTGLMAPDAGQFLYPGTLKQDLSYRPTADKKIAGLQLVDNQFVYIDDKAVLSNAWAGRVYYKHTLPKADIFDGTADHALFLISDSKSLQLVGKDGQLWEGSLNDDKVLDIQFDRTRNLFWILGEKSISKFTTTDKKLTSFYTGSDLTCLAPATGKLVVGTKDGYLELNLQTGKALGEIKRRLPNTYLTSVAEIDGSLWFGSKVGAFMLRKDGKFNYYASERWIPGDEVKHISRGDGNSILILTTKGLGKIVFEKMTLHDKAVHYDKQVRLRHVRNGFNGTLAGMKNGDLSTGSMEDSDNDGLWSTMYLGGEVFRYAVTKDKEALQNLREGMDAIQRLYDINGLKGFPSRSFERRGYKYDDEPWRRAEDPEWDWKSTTSSDEVIGHIFLYGTLAELVDDKALKTQAIELLDAVMGHIVENDLYLIDWDGKTTLWGKWHPDYVNGFPTIVGDRKLNSSNIIGMLQTAYHFTKKEKYKTKAFELMQKHGYLENLTRPIAEIGKVEEGTDDWAKELSDAWNHSDDEMYYMGYWGLYRYAFNDTLKTKYKKAIIDHWEVERPEKDGLWNIATALTGTTKFDLDEAAWYLREYPMDLISWTIKNSDRKDIDKIAPNFRKQTTKEVLPPDELGMARHNANRFALDKHGRGASEYSAGDIWLLPYWMGRYLGVISAPVKTTPAK
jgi:hypothetical protein